MEPTLSHIVNALGLVVKVYLTPPPLPPESAWFSWKGRRWATDGGGLYSESLLPGRWPMPYEARWPGDLNGRWLEAEDIKAQARALLKDMSAEVSKLPRTLAPVSVELVQERRTILRHTGGLIAIDNRFAHLLHHYMTHAHTTPQGGPMIVFHRNLELAAVVMPLRVEIVEGSPPNEDTAEPDLHDTTI